MREIRTYGSLEEFTSTVRTFVREVNLLMNIDMDYSNKKEYMERIYYGMNYSLVDEMNVRKGVIVMRRRILPFFNVALLFDMINRMFEIFYQGYIPYIDYLEEDGFMWDHFFVQPFQKEVQSFQKNEWLMEDDVGIKPVFNIIYEMCYDKRIRKMLENLFRDFIILNDSTKKYILNEYNKLLLHKNVIGAVYRGTDMIKNKLSYHPIQPNIEQMIGVIESKMNEFDCNYIYLATEEEVIEKAFKQYFPHRILTNKRHYMGEEFKKKGEIHNNKTVWIQDIVFDSNIPFFSRGLEYLSSIILLSECRILIGGNCGATAAALYFNKDRYIFKHIFNLGLYP